MDRKTAENTATASVQGANTSEPTLGRVMAFLFLVSFVGLLVIVPMRKVSLVVRSCLGSFLWSAFQWFYTGGPNCGFTAFPTFGLPAYNRGFYINMNGTYVGVGMISPYLINISMLVGSIISWGFMWPYLLTKKGDWYDANLQETSLKGLNGYKVFGAIAMILGDGIFQLVVISLRTIHTMRHHQVTAAETMRSFSDLDSAPRPVLSFDDRRRTQVFLREHIPSTFAIGGYVVLAVLSSAAVPLIYRQVRFYHVAAAYVFAPLLAFCNAYGTGVAETNFSAQYNKLVILLFASWIGASSGGIVGSLVICGVVSSVVSTASDFMSDFKTGYLTLTSPRATLVSQVIGTALGCVVNPVIFNVFHHFYESNNSKYQAPLAKVYRAIAVVGAGDHELPKHCLAISVALFALALAVSAARELAVHNRWPAQHYIPSVTGMAISFLLVPAVSIDMCVGSLILYAWNATDKEDAQVFAPVLASGLICGDGLFSIPYALLARYDVTPPICVKFLGRVQNKLLDEYLEKAAQ
nr:unnamed protein product [Digitaria exilis]